jgi:hypothetical protein
MTKRCLTINRLFIPLALTAVVSLAIAQGLNLGHQTLGAGHGSTAAMLGDIAGLIGCAISARFGLRQLRRTRTC